MAARKADNRPHAFTGRFAWAGYLLGFALGGFFDGILLHQILQWHHLLSAVEGAAFRDLRVQVLADGLFHAAMYVIAAVGLWLLWRARHEFAAPGADRLLVADALIGFGVWHVVDGVLSHWILGIHRIRMAAENVLLWDLIWFFGFGVLFIAAGWLIRHRTGPGGGARVGRRAVAPVLLAAAVLAAGPVAALPPPDPRAVMVLFRPGTDGGTVFAAVAAGGGRAGAEGQRGDPRPRPPRRGDPGQQPGHRPAGAGRLDRGAGAGAAGATPRVHPATFCLHLRTFDDAASDPLTPRKETCRRRNRTLRRSRTVLRSPGGPS